MYSILMFVVRNHNIYQTSNNSHHIYILDRSKSYVSSVSLSSIQRGVLYSVMVYNNLPQNIQILSDVKIFKCTLKNFISNAFSSMDEYISARHI
jgi:hypothetical protein